MARRRERIGFFGGTFDPPHVGHVTVAADVADALALERVVWVPAATPPHKQEQALSPGPARLEMVEMACRADPRFQASTVELERGGVSYTVDTLGRLRARWPEAHWTLILGVDQFRSMDTDWKEPEQVLRLATIAVMDREGESAREAVPNVSGADQATFVPVTRVDISSTGIRNAVAEGVDVSSHLPPGVMAIIEREGLYSG